MASSGKRVLFVDDEVSIVDSVVEFLAIAGFEVVGLTDPLETESMWREREFDVAIVDLSMPVPELRRSQECAAEVYDVVVVEYGRTTGIEMAKRMHSARPKIPIIALTVVSEGLVSHRLTAAGIVKVLNKPIEPASLVDTLNSVLRQ